jgi:hypothetical protein
MTTTAVVLHNVSVDMFWAYKPKTSALHHAHTFQVDDNAAPTRLLETVWTLTNCDPADAELVQAYFPELAHYFEQAVSYRARMNRSLSVGDVVVLLHGEDVLGAWAVEKLGWAPVDRPSIDLSDVHNERAISQAYEAYQRFVTAKGA